MEQSLQRLENSTITGRVEPVLTIPAFVHLCMFGSVPGPRALIPDAFEK